jgi:hypothetical protein
VPSFTPPLNVNPSSRRTRRFEYGREMVLPHAIGCDRIPVRSLDQLAHSVFRAVTRKGNYELNRPKLLRIVRRKPARVFTIERTWAISA